ncbi:MAG: methyltransferase domain-containing protein [Bacteroidota bacterium]
MPKSTVDEIRARFDADVERFSNLDTGQSSTPDAPLMLELVTDAAARTTPLASRVLDMGCGAGNYTLKLLQRLPQVEVTLVDLSQPMLDRATQRITAAGGTVTQTHAADLRTLTWDAGSFDIIMASMVLHHLRSPAEWHAVLARCHRALRPGGGLWIADFFLQATAAVDALMWARYGEYLRAFKGEAYRDHVFAYIEKEDSPAPLMQVVDALRHAGFSTVELLHKNGLFAALGAIR